MTAVQPAYLDEESVIVMSNAPVRSRRKAPTNWQPQLVNLLAMLEHHRAELDGRRLGSHSLEVLNHVEAMVQAAEELAEQTEFPRELVTEQTDAIARAGAFMTMASGVRTRRSGVIKTFWTSLAGRPTEAIAPAVREAMHAAVDALNAYFMLFTSHFGSSSAAREWVDAASIFLAELRRLARELPD